MSRSVKVTLTRWAVAATFLVAGGSATTARAEVVEAAHKPALKKFSYWDDAGDARWFVSSRLDLGIPYLKTQVAAGYGKPFWLWAGVEAFAMSTHEMGSVYAGLRGSLPFADVQVGVADTYSYSRSFQPERASHTRDEVQTLGASRAHYTQLQFGLAGGVPAPGGFVAFEATGYYTTNAPPGVHIYDESFRALFKPPWIAVNRLGYVLGFGKASFVKVGALGELVLLPGRNDRVWRLGPAAVVDLTDHLSLLAALTFAFHSPDSLGTSLGAYGMGGLRYQWASQDRTPHFP